MLINILKEFFLNKHISVSEDWLIACIDWIKNEYSSRNINNKCWIKAKVFEQWLHSDLRELGTVCMPSNLSEVRVTKITGPFAVQINEVRDIGTPAYVQLKKIRNIDMSNALVSAMEEKNDSKNCRMLMLTLMDGMNSLKAIEYKPIPCLSLSLKPGIKILLLGTIEVRKGVLLLCKENVSIFGGDVEDLCNENSVENVICRSLSIINTIIEEQPNANVVRAEGVSVVDQNIYSNAINNIKEDDCHSAFNEDEDDIFMIPMNEFEENSQFDQPCSSSSIPQSNSSAISYQSAQSNTSVSAGSCNLQSFFSPSAASSSSQSHPNKRCISTNVSLRQTSVSNFFSKNKSVPPVAQIKQSPSRFLLQSPFMYLCQIDELAHEQEVEFTVKGFVLTLTSKLEQTHGNWKLAAKINDGTGTIQVQIHSQVIENLIGMSVCEMAQHKEAAKTDVSLKKSLTQRIIGCQSKLISTSGLLCLKLTRMPRLIELINILELQELHSNAIGRRNV